MLIGGASFRIRSFVMGAFFASIIWGVIIYVYISILETSLSHKDNETKVGTLSQTHFKNKDLFDVDASFINQDSRPAHHNLNEILNESVEKKKHFYNKKKFYKEKFHNIDKEWKDSLINNELPGDPFDVNLNDQKHPERKESINLGELGLVKTIVDQETSLSHKDNETKVGTLSQTHFKNKDLFDVDASFINQDSRPAHHNLNEILNESVEKKKHFYNKKKFYKEKFHNIDKEWKDSLINNELPGDPFDVNLNDQKHPERKESINLGELGLVKTIVDQEDKDKGYRLHAFNTLISSRLSLHRPIPDTRHEKCRDLKYSSNLPDASIIVCFYREEMSALLRTIHSILDRSPKHILKEIILVDDTNDVEYHLEVKGNVSGISDKIKLIRTHDREGLIRARIYGAQHATGQVLVFLDSHVEVNKMWLEPLLSRVQEKESNVVAPIIDVISPDSFEYTSATLVRGGFNWGLHFKWDSIPVSYFADKSNFYKPIKSPTMAGGLFAINRKYFKDIGEYDPGMDVWGGENLEISFRVWMCGGTLEIIPCSRVGHIFRRRRPYGDVNGENSLLKNSLRLAHVWLDEYKERFYEVQPAARHGDYGNISDRQKLRKDLKCQSFKWYLQNIYPEILNKSADTSPVLGGRKFERWDQRQRNYINQWQIQLINSSLCIESEEEPNHKGSRLIMSPCASIPRQLFYQTDKDELVLAKLLCLEASSKTPRLGKCHDMKGNQEWKVTREEKVALYNIAAGLCLSASEERSGAYVEMALCSTPSLGTWNMLNSKTMS